MTPEEDYQVRVQAYAFYLQNPALHDYETVYGFLAEAFPNAKSVTIVPADATVYPPVC